MIGRALIALALAAPTAAAQDLIAHEAAYRLAPLEVREQRFLAAEGRLERSLIQTCDGWRMRTRFLLQLTARDGRLIESDIGSLLDETDDGAALRFQTRSWRLGGLVDDALGAGDRSELRFERPAGATVAGDPELVFPIGELRALLAAADAGRPRLSYRVFDGSEPTIFEASAAFGPAMTRDAPGAAPIFAAIEADLESAAADDPQAMTRLPDGPVRPIRIAYFDASDPRPDPVSETEARYAPGGIMVAALFDFGDVVFQADLSRLRRAAPPEDCG